MRPTQPNSTTYSRAETLGSAIAHSSALLVGLPLFPFLALPLSLAPCPVVAYLIARAFRRRKLAWGAFQGMQACIMQLLIFLLMFIADQISRSPGLLTTLWTAGVLLFLYSLWGAWDTFLGYDFRYIGISDLLDRVSRANLNRSERRRRWLGGWSEQDNQQR
jgi:fatty acid desaturase